MLHLHGLIKTAPLVGVLAALSARDIALYAGMVVTLGALMVIGAIWAAAKAWRERAEARTDEAIDLRDQLGKAEQRIASLEATVDELRRRTDVKDLGRQLMQEHREIIAAVRGIQTAVEFMFKQVFPAAVIAVTDDNEGGRT